MNNKVVITGLGLITALGNNVEETWKNICAGKHGFSDITAWDNTSYAVKIGAQIKFPLDDLIKNLHYRGNDRCHLLSLIAAYEALNDAFSDLSYIKNKHRVAIVVGTSLAGMISMQEYDTLTAHGKKGDISALYNEPMHVCADIIANEFTITGPRSVISTACTASTIAVSKAATLIRANQVDTVIVCGCDPLSYFSFSGFSSMQNVSAIPCSPFSENIGLSLGEAAGVIVLERLDHAEARQARIYAELIDYALSCDAYHPTSPDPSSKSQLKLINQLLQRSDIAIEKINYINAHGTGTNGNDVTESLGIEMAFNKQTENVFVTSNKGNVGHTLGAAGAVETILTIKAIQNSIIPPTTNFTKARKNCSLNYVPNQAIEKHVNYAITQNFAFGGNNAAILFSKYNKSKYKNIYKPKRVVVTGIGIIAPQNLSAYQDSQGVWYKCGLVPEFKPNQYVPFNLRRADRFGQLILSAAHLTLKNSNLTINKDNTERAGIILGTANGHASTNLQFHRDIVLKGPDKVNPIIFPNTVLNAGVGLASIHLQLKSCSIALSMGQMSGLLALSYAYDLIRDEVADVIIAGGADEMNDYVLDCYARSGLIRKNRNKNALKLKDKMCLNEGACFVVLESYESAIKRNAKIYAEVLGYSANSISYKNKSENTCIAAIERSMQLALQNANLNPDAIQSIYLSGIKYKKHNQHEKAAIHNVFANQIEKINMHDTMGTSAITDVLSVGVQMEKYPNLSSHFIVNSASIGGANMSMVFQKCI